MLTSGCRSPERAAPILPRYPDSAGSPIDANSVVTHAAQLKSIVAVIQTKNPEPAERVQGFPIAGEPSLGSWVQ